MNASQEITQTNFQEIKDAIANAEWVPWQNPPSAVEQFKPSGAWYAVVMGDDNRPLSTIAKFSGPDAE